MRRLSLLLVLPFLATACQPPSADEVAATTGESVVCGRGPIVEGIDVSYWQGAIDWSAVAGDGIHFAIIRISDGTYHDTRFAENWSGAQSAGLIRGAYQFFEPDVDPNTQADIVISAVGVLGPGDMPVTLDVEAPSPSVSPATYAARIHTWVDRVTAGTGRAPMIYTGRYYWDPYVASSDFASLPLWHAQYTSASCPNINDRWSDWTFWQYTSTGSVSGISGNVDRNRFNGTMDELSAFAMSNRPPTGWLDAADCTEIRGWAQDPDAPTTSIDVHIYVGGPAGDPGAMGFPIHADVSRADLCAAIGSCEHGFSFPTPSLFMDGVDRPVYAYGIDAMGGTNALLSGAPMTLHCDAPPPPPPPPPADAGAPPPELDAGVEVPPADFGVGSPYLPDGAVPPTRDGGGAGDPGLGPTRHQLTGGCSTSGAGGLGALPSFFVGALVLALVALRRRRSSP